MTFLDDTIDPAERFDADSPRPGAVIDGFAAVQTLERTDAMDMAASSFTPDEEDFSGMACDVAKLVLEPVELPWLFRLASYSSPRRTARPSRRPASKA